MNVCRIDIDEVEQVLPHEADVALQLVGLHRIVFVEVERDDVAKRESLFAVHPHQFVVDADRRAAGGQTQHAIAAFRLPRANRICNHPCRRGAGIARGQIRGRECVRIRSVR